MSSLLSIQALEEALALLFQHNFDADSKTCMITLMKVLDNVLHKPGDDKVRKIRLQNAAFTNKVASRKGGIEYLLACGFERRQVASAPLLSGANAVGDEHLVLVREDTLHLMTARRLLQTRAIQDLKIPREELPEYRPPPTVQPTAAAAAANPTTFNPYQGQRYDAKSAAVGANLGPDNNYVSPTELELQRLQKQQAKLQSQAQKAFVNREWTAIIMRPAGETTGAVISTLSSSQPTTNNNKGDSSLLAAHAKKLHEERMKREHGGFTTQAMRNVERLKKTKVYSHVTLTIQFANGCKLVGKFLPSETIAQVITAIQQDCLLSQAGVPAFDLYVTPPRRQLPSKSTLQQEQLVPAAKVFLSWKSQPPATFLRPELLSSTNAAAFPTSKPVDQQQAKTDVAAAGNGDNKQPAAAVSNNSREDDLLRRMMGGKPGGLLGGGAASKKKPASGGVPKWFKK